MIHQISFRNFYSFKDENIINFSVNNKAPKTEAYFKNSSDNRLSTVLAVFGANASGKTNYLKAVHFLKWFVLNSFEKKPSEEIPFKPFIFDTNDNKSSSVSITFEIDEDIYFYSLEFNLKQVISENLSLCSKNKRVKHLFKRKWIPKSKSYNFDLKNFGLSIEFKQFVKLNTSVISAGIYVGHGLSNKIKKFFESIRGNVVERGRREISGSDSEPLFAAAEFFNNNKVYKVQAEELLRKYDLGLSGIEYKEHEFESVGSAKKESIFFPYGVHKKINSKKTLPLPFIYESGGTVNLFILLRELLPVLQNGGVLALDEFDADLHPFMIPELLQLFTSKITNKKNAQLLFSTHHPELLNRLDKYQIVLVEKNENGVSEAWRLDEMKGIRPDENYYTKYISGAYGAVPNFK